MPLVKRKDLAEELMQVRRNLAEASRDLDKMCEEKHAVIVRMWNLEECLGTAIDELSKSSRLNRQKLIAAIRKTLSR